LPAHDTTETANLVNYNTGESTVTPNSENRKRKWEENYNGFPVKRSKRFLEEKNKTQPALIHLN